MVQQLKVWTSLEDSVLFQALTLVSSQLLLMSIPGALPPLGSVSICNCTTHISRQTNMYVIKNNKDKSKKNPLPICMHEDKWTHTECK